MAWVNTSPLVKTYKELCLADEIARASKCVFCAAIVYDEGQIFVKGAQLTSNVIQGLMIAVIDVFRD